jgi:hypothetical protein
MCAVKPLRSARLLAAARITVDATNNFGLEAKIDEEALLSLCKDFLVVDAGQGVWRFAHLSVQERLVGKELLGLPQAHDVVATVLLSLLINMEKEGDDGSVAEAENAAVTRDDELDTYDQLRTYATLYWGNHARAAQRYKDCTLAPILKRFLGSPNESSSQYVRWEARWEDVSNNYYPAFRCYMATQLSPGSQAAFAVCCFSLDTILADWWHSAEIDLSMVNSHGHSLLIVAVLAGHSTMVELLIRKGITVTARCRSDFYCSALVAAANKGDVDIARALVKA